MKTSSVITVAATTILAASSAHANYNINSNFWRAGTTSGLGGVLSNMVGWSVAGSATGITATAPSGINSWTDFSFPSVANLWAFGPGGWNGTSFNAGSFDVATASAWHETNAKGAWSFNANGTTTTIDTTSAWVPIENRVFSELDAASSQLFFNLLANGTTGTFTFNLKQAAATNLFWIVSGPSSGSGSLSGAITSGTTSFTVTLTQALASDALMQLGHNTQTNLEGGTFTVASGVAYGTAISVPTPGALALIGLAGLAGRRRR